MWGVGRKHLWILVYVVIFFAAAKSVVFVGFQPRVKPIADVRPVFSTCSQVDVLDLCEDEVGNEGMRICREPPLSGIDSGVNCIAKGDLLPRNQNVCTWLISFPTAKLAFRIDGEKGIPVLDNPGKSSSCWPFSTICKEDGKRGLLASIEIRNALQYPTHPWPIGGDNVRVGFASFVGQSARLGGSIPQLSSLQIEFFNALGNLPIDSPRTSGETTAD